MDASDTTRHLLVVHYDGSGFHGWQLQPDRRTVQGVLQEALGRLASQPCLVTGSGRTDAGVHAKGQVASADLPAKWTPDELRRALNATLPRDVWIESARGVPAGFHARYDAVARTYEYRIGTRPEAASPFHRFWCWPLAADIDRGLLAEAATPVCGEHSFAAFSKAGQPERGERCTVSVAQWSQWDLGALFTVTADRYLHHMVRYLVGTMVEVARGRRPLEDVARLLDNDPDLTTSPPAPPEGLFLSRVEYPDNVLLGRPPSALDRSDPRA